MSQVIRALGVDAAMANMGLATVDIHLQPSIIVQCLDLRLIKTEGEDRKTVRKSSDNLRRAKMLHAGLQAGAAGVTIAFAEVPTGSQSSAAASALGIAVGVLASCPVPILEVSPMEVKRLFGNTRKGATKSTIIEWAVKRWPNAPWLRHNGRLTAANEHLADALATIVAGINTPDFQLFRAAYGTSNSDNDRPAPRRRAVLRV